MCGTIKDNIIEDDANFPKILACSIYDTKPIHILRTFTDNITWNTKKIWYKDKESFVEIDYLRLNIIDDYNYLMGGINVTDQLRLQCRVDFCVALWH